MLAAVTAVTIHSPMIGIMKITNPTANIFNASMPEASPKKSDDPKCNK